MKMLIAILILLLIPLLAHADKQFCARPRTYNQMPLICLEGYTCPVDTDANLKDLLQGMVKSALRAMSYDDKDVAFFFRDYAYGWREVRSVRVVK